MIEIESLGDGGYGITPSNLKKAIGKIKKICYKEENTICAFEENTIRHIEWILRSFKSNPLIYFSKETLEELNKIWKRYK